MSEPVQTTFWQLHPLGLGVASKWDGDTKVGLQTCSRETFTDLKDADIWSPIYVNPATGEETSELPLGAMYFSDYGRPGPDGKALVVKLPNGLFWYVDSRASNCTLKDDNIHFCWVRHGDPAGCEVTVDKNGHTCSAGAGSIDSPGHRREDGRVLREAWHGFLQGGKLIRC